MKRCIFAFFAFFYIINPVCANDNISQSIEDIYQNCLNKFPLLTPSSVIQGNIEDVKRERNLRQCLKDKVLEIAKSSLSEKEFNNFISALNENEKSNSEIYRIIFFCKNDSESIWCKERYKDDMSLEKLMMEKNLTSQIMQILNLLIEKQGDYKL